MNIASDIMKVDRDAGSGHQTNSAEKSPIKKMSKGHIDPPRCVTLHSLARCQSEPWAHSGHNRTCRSGGGPNPQIQSAARKIHDASCCCTTAVLGRQHE